MRKIKRELVKEFPDARIVTTNGNHYRIELANGRHVIASNTPGRGNFMHRVRRDVRRELSKRPTADR